MRLRVGGSGGAVLLLLFAVLAVGAYLVLRGGGGTSAGSEPLTPQEWGQLEDARVDFPWPDGYRFLEVKQRGGAACEADLRCRGGVLITSFTADEAITCGQVAALATASGLGPDPDGTTEGDCAVSVRTEDVSIALEIGRCASAPCLVARFSLLDR